LDHVYRVTDIDAPGYWWNFSLVEGPVSLQGIWIDEKTFSMDMLIFHHRVHSSTLVVHFEEGGSIGIDIHKRYMSTVPSVFGAVKE